MCLLQNLLPPEQRISAKSSELTPAQLEAKLRLEKEHKQRAAALLSVISVFVAVSENEADCTAEIVIHEETL